VISVNFFFQQTDVTFEGWLMFSMCLLTALSILLLLAPPKMAMNLLGLLWIPLGGRYTLLLAVTVNVGLSLAFEEWGTQGVSFVIGWIMGWLQQQRWRTGKKAVYKLVEGGMR
jgi:cation-transporting ATPase 13A3/4/5